MSMSSINTLDAGNTSQPSPAQVSHLEGIALAFYDKVQEKQLIQDRKYRLQTYTNVMLGTDAVTVLVELLTAQGYQKVSREEALQLGREMNAQFGLIQHVANDHELKDEKLFYRFHNNLPSQVQQARMALHHGDRWEMMALLESHFDVQDRVYHFRTYPQCFVGREAVDVIMRLQLAISREQAVQLVKDLNREVACLEHVTRDHEFADAYLFFRFIPRQERMLNPNNEGQTLAAMYDAMVAAEDNGYDTSASSDNGDFASSDLSEEALEGEPVEPTSKTPSTASDTASVGSDITELRPTQVLALLPPNTTLQDIAKILERDLVIKDHRYRFTVYKNCFIAKDAVTYMVKAGLAPSRSRAELIGRQLQAQLNLFHHVTQDHKFRDKYYFFRFTPPEERKEPPAVAPASDSKKGNNNAVGQPSIPEGRQLAYQRETSKASIQMDLEQSNTKLEDIAVAFERGMKVQDRIYRLRTYKNAFSGPQAIKYLVKKGYAENRQDAMLMGRLLAEEFYLFEHVGNVEKELMDCPTTLYQIVPAEERKARVEIRDREKGEMTAVLEMEPDEQQQQQKDDAAGKDADPELKKLGALFRQGVKIKHNRYHGKLYRNTFIGSQAVDFMVNSSIADSRKEAVQIGRRLMHELQQFDHVLRSHDFTDDYKFYRFEEHRTQSQGKNEASASQVLSDSFSALGSTIRKRISSVTPLQSSDFSGGTDFLPLEAIALEFRKNVSVKDRRYRFSTYKDVFVGSAAVDFLLGNNSTWVSSRKEAVQLGQALMTELNLFQHVTQSHSFLDDELFYRFNDDDIETMSQRLQAVAGDDAIPLFDQTSKEFQDRLINVARSLEEGLEPKEHSFRLRVYKDTVCGNEIVSFIVDKGLASSRAEALHLGRSVCKHFTLFFHVTMDHILKDSTLFYRFTPRSRRDKGKWFEESFGDTLRNKMMRAARRRNNLSVQEYWEMVADAVDNDIWDVRYSLTKESNFRSFQVESDDAEWAQRVRSFEKSAFDRRMSAALEPSTTAEHRRSTLVAAGPTKEVSRLNCWASAFIRLDPRQQIHRFYNEVAQTGACVQVVENEGGHTRESVRALTLNDFRPLFLFLPMNLANVFSVWRPTSYDAIRKMMVGDAVGKGLDIKGKSAKRGKLSGYVPFLQIGNNNHKKHVRRRSPSHMVKVFYARECRRARDAAIVELEKVLTEMLETVTEAKKILAMGDRADKDLYDNALEMMLLDVDNPCITPIEDYAPECHGIEMPERLFWEAYFARQDCTRTAGSIYDSGRPSQPAFQDMNFAALRSSPTEEAPKPVIFQNADRDDPMNPFEMLLAYEEHGRVRPVVSDFDCFLVGTRRVQYSMQLPEDQQNVLKWCVTQIETVANRMLRDIENGVQEKKSWSLLWLEILKESSFHPEIPQFGFGDPVSYSIVANAVERLNVSGAVRHGAECFNYYFPQDLDDEFLVCCEGMGRNGNVPWAYVGVDELQDFLAMKIDEGYCFPLNPKWILMDPGFMYLYNRMLTSSDKNTQQAMDVWFPPESGLREDIDRIYDIQKKLRKAKGGRDRVVYNELSSSQKMDALYFL